MSLNRAILSSSDPVLIFKSEKRWCTMKAWVVHLGSIDNSAHLIFFPMLFSTIWVFLGVSLILLSAFAFVVQGGRAIVFEIEIVAVSRSRITLSLVVDFISTLFLFSVTLIAVRVYLFSSYYVQGMPAYNQFHLILSIFVISILVLILRPNLFSLILGWDGLGVSSYLLVVFYKRAKSFNARLITGITNRLGDRLILTALPLILASPSFCAPLALPIHISPRSWGLMVLTTAACTKRAQLPFSSWLPAAMAAPTPVSALVHSSTLVTAGVYVLIRITPWLTRARLNLLASLGSVTIMIASLSALLENDGKKIVALSTLSQLGLMIVRFCLSLPIIVFFHLLAHAFFKALLFIATGVIIHRRSNYQDLRLMKGLGTRVRITKRVVVITKLSLIGVPGFAAYFSKEIVIESMSSRETAELLPYLAIITGVALTVLYRIRFVFLAIWGPTQTPSSNIISEGNNYLIVSTLCLLFPRALSGKLLFFRLSPLFPSVVISASAKLVTTAFLLLPSLLLIKIRGQSPGTEAKFFSFMWGLPVWAGGLAPRALQTGGLRFFSFSLFRGWDYLLGLWAFNPATSVTAKFAGSGLRMAPSWAAITAAIIRLTFFS